MQQAWELRHGYNEMWFENMKGRDQLGDLSVDNRITLKRK
jgi:hypothetical protein